MKKTPKLDEMHSTFSHSPRKNSHTKVVKKVTRLLEKEKLSYFELNTLLKEVRRELDVEVKSPREIVTAREINALLRPAM
jgi:hypothetical protein